jgi:hypothetical protein
MADGTNACHAQASGTCRYQALVRYDHVARLYADAAAQDGTPENEHCGTHAQRFFVYNGPRTVLNGFPFDQLLGWPNLWSTPLVMTVENVITILGLLGVGGILGTYLRILWERKNEAEIHKQEFKETRYKCVILFMYVALDFENRAPLLRPHGRNFADLESLLEELRTEWHNMILFASEDVLVSVHAFIRKPSISEFHQGALAMREDLWGGKVSAQVLNLDFNLSGPT